MFSNLYAFFYDWLFNSQAVTYLSEQGQEFACIVCSLLVLVGVIALAFAPIKVLFRFIFRY